MRRTISTLLHPYRTAAYYTASNPILRAGQVAYESDTRLSKVGDGATPWISLPYIGSTRSPYKPAGALGENLDRLAIIEANNLSCLVSGTVLCTALDVLPGQPVTTLFFTSGTTALVTGTNQWAGVCDSNYKILSISSDYTNTAWAINTVRPFTQLVPVGAPLLGPCFSFLMVAAATVPTMTGMAKTSQTLSNFINPVLNFRADTGKTTPPAVGSSLTLSANQGQVPYVYYS